MKDFLKEYKDVCQDLNVEDDLVQMKKYLKYIKTRIENKNSINVTSDLEIEWYKSLDEDILNPNYLVYASKHYFKEVLGCWIVYSRDYIQRLNRCIAVDYNIKIIDMLQENIETVVDLGNGVGYSTIAWNSTPNMWISKELHNKYKTKNLIEELY